MFKNLHLKAHALFKIRTFNGLRRLTVSPTESFGKMRYVSAYLLAVLGGNQNPQVDDLKKILSTVGVDTDAETAKIVVSRLQGKSIEQLIAEGASGLVSVSGGGGAPAAAAPSAGAAAPAAAAAESKPAKKEEKEESDDDMGFGLFD
ncbi:unnamed protein product [Caenorhabditis auriculariae]|uniref:Large ribosomal subunit protein P2 n=1 Tax=Caenorhabditis auriculariae TaxID=2777116 RepID=A0A8S1H9U8_9PELO|nr:unnamed protein product [Caenorhabditis auriculariae]